MIVPSSSSLASLARPRATDGYVHPALALTAKWLELAKELVRGLSRVAVLGNGANPTHSRFWAEAQSSARDIGLTVYNVDVRSPGDFDNAFTSMAHERVGAVVVLPDPMLRSGRTRLPICRSSCATSIFPIPRERVAGPDSYFPILGQTSGPAAAT